MKKILSLSIVALMVIGLVAGGTWAFFSDTETSEDNSFTAGTLNLTLNGEDGDMAAALFEVEDVNPGEDGVAGTWVLVNNGTLAGYIDLSGITVTNAENYDEDTDEAEADDDADTSDETGGGELAANLDVVIFIDDGAGEGNPNDGVKSGDEATIYSGKLGSISATYDQDLALAAGGTTYICMTWDVADEVDNKIMGDSATLEITFDLDQTAD